MKAWILFATLIGITKFIWANGSPINESAYRSSGSIEPQMETDANLTHEKLSLTAVKDNVAVDVLYTVDAGSATTTAYAFPINFFASIGFDSGGGPNVYKVVEGFQILCNGFSEKVAWKEKDIKGDSDGDFTEGTWWAVTYLKLIAGKNQIEVRYLTRPERRDMLYSKSSHPQFFERKFVYSFKLAKNWNDSRPDVDIEVNLCGVLAEGGSLRKITMASGETAQCIWDTSYHNVDLGNFKDLEFAYNRADAAFQNYIVQNTVSEDSISSTAIPATLPNLKSVTYYFNNLFDGNPATVWATHLKSDSLPMHIKFECAPLHGIGLLNGCAANEQYYLENARIKSGKLNGEKFDLPDRPFDSFDLIHPYKSLDWIFDLGDEPGLTRVDLEIDSVYPGSKYQDLCIGEMVLLK